MVRLTPALLNDRSCRTVGVACLVVFLLGSCATHRSGKSLVAATVNNGQENHEVKAKPGTYRVLGKDYEVLPDSLGYVEIGIASWYGSKFHGRLTSNGEIYDMYQLTAAHKALPLPTFVQVTNLDNGRKAVVRVNDRGPFHDDRVIDLSWQAAVQLGFADKGTAPVVVEALDEKNYPDRVSGHQQGSSFYLQVGAFTRVQGAETLMDRIRHLLADEAGSVPVRILQSEIETGILHKVWIGPIETLDEEEKIAVLVSEADLGKPIKVEVD